MGVTTTKTIEYAKEIFKSKGLILIEKEYVNKNTKMDCFDNNGYKYKLSLDAVSDKRTKRFEPIGKFNPYFAENLDNFIRINKGDCKLITREYIKSNEKITLKCNCDNNYNITVCHFLGEKKFTCNKCSFEKSNKSKLFKSELETQNKLKEIGYELVEFITKNKIVIKDNDGYLYNTTLYNATNEAFTFNKFQRFHRYNKFTIHNMINYLKLNNIEIEMVNKTERQIKTKTDYIEWFCIECGEIFKATWGQVIYDNSNSTPRRRCSKCSKSRSNLEYIVEQYLIEKQIDYIKQYKFKDCKDIGFLPFDFYFSEYNIACEVNGSQHYYENDIFSQSLSDRRRVDKIKKEYCIKNNIKFLEIPYWKIINKHNIKGYKILIDNILNQD